MRFSSFKQTSLLFVIVITALSCNQKITSTIAGSEKVEVTSVASENPIIKRLESNPVLRIRAYIPPSAKTKNISSVNLMLNDSGLKNIEEIQVYYRGIEPLFNAAKPVATIKPSSLNFEIPVSIEMKPGLSYIWIGATLKENTDLADKVEVSATNLIESSGESILIEKNNNDSKKRLGIAVRKSGDDGVNSYRIPGIITTDKGTLIAVYDIRYKNSGDLPGNIDVGMSRSIDGGQSWQPMKTIMDMGAPHENNGVGDPSVLFDPVTKKLFVAALWSKGNRSIAGSEPGLSPETTGQFVLVSSDDDGLTWSAPYSITSQVKDPKWHIYFNGPGNGIAMEDGTLVFPSQYWDESKKPGLPHSSIIYSDDHGKTWKSGIGAKLNTTESQVVETTPGTLMLNMRDNRGEFRSVSTTSDLGKTWTEHPTSYNALPDPVCMASIIKAVVNVKGKKQEILFFSNPNTVKGRYNISIQASLDLGETWMDANKILIDERECFGYSCLTKIDDNTIGILYEGTRDLYFVRISVSDIL